MIYDDCSILFCDTLVGVWVCVLLCVHLVLPTVYMMFCWVGFTDLCEFFFLLTKGS